MKCIIYNFQTTMQACDYSDLLKRTICKIEKEDSDLSLPNNAILIKLTRNFITQKIKWLLKETLFMDFILKKIVPNGLKIINGH